MRGITALDVRGRSRLLSISLKKADKHSIWGKVYAAANQHKRGRRVAVLRAGSRDPAQGVLGLWVAVAFVIRELRGGAEGWRGEDRFWMSNDPKEEVG